MSDYRDNPLYSLSSDQVYYCPYSMSRSECPFAHKRRQRVEEYPIPQQQPPKNPPPNYTPKLTDVASPNILAVSFDAISPCIYKYTYLWLKNGDAFWSYLVIINHTLVGGWQYKSGQWVYFTVNLPDIKNFICS